MCAKSLQSCPTLCDPIDCSPPGSSVPGILQAGMLEWVAVPSSRGSSRPRDGTRVSYVSYIGRRFFTTRAPVLYFKYLVILFVNYTSVKLKKEQLIDI